MAIGIGITVFFSGMVMSMGDNKLLLANPFVLVMKPAAAALDLAITAASVIETFLFCTAGMLLIKNLKYE